MYNGLSLKRRTCFYAMSFAYDKMLKNVSKVVNYLSTNCIGKINIFLQVVNGVVALSP